MRRSGRGFALVELLISISIPAIMERAIPGATAALLAAHSQSNEFYQSLRSGRFVVNRIQNDLRRARLVPTSDAANLVYWTGDANSDRHASAVEIGIPSFRTDPEQLCPEGVFFADSMDSETKATSNTDLTLFEIETAEDTTTLIRETYCACHVERLLSSRVVSFSLKMGFDAPLTKLVGIVNETAAQGSHVLVSGQDSAAGDDWRLEKEVSRINGGLVTTYRGYDDMLSGSHVLNYQAERSRARDFSGVSANLPRVEILSWDK